MQRLRLFRRRAVVEQDLVPADRTGGKPEQLGAVIPDRVRGLEYVLAADPVGIRLLFMRQDRLDHGGIRLLLRRGQPIVIEVAKLPFRRAVGRRRRVGLAEAFFPDRRGRFHAILQVLRAGKCGQIPERIVPILQILQQLADQLAVTDAGNARRAFIIAGPRGRLRVLSDVLQILHRNEGAQAFGVLRGELGQIPQLPKMRQLADQQLRKAGSGERLLDVDPELLVDIRAQRDVGAAHGQAGSALQCIDDLCRRLEADVRLLLHGNAVCAFQENTDAANIQLQRLAVARGEVFAAFAAHFPPVRQFEEVIAFGIAPAAKIADRIFRDRVHIDEPQIVPVVAHELRDLLQRSKVEAVRRMIQPAVQIRVLLRRG